MTPREVLLMIEARHHLVDKKLRQHVAELSAEIRNGASMVSSHKAYRTTQKSKDVDPDAFLPWDLVES
jgi:hypothetical protein